ncbi:Caleosin-domain-containing protein [Dichomitus squalens]|uniref:Caleosin-domain-containing protein n=1 Tax=Dichomitus squalens TaxID=114155 RepID=A0A4Q9PLD1_9APHY|nr:Caleosin-domain-containing protein [Dichomitus squalens]
MRKTGAQNITELDKLQHPKVKTAIPQQTVTMERPPYNPPSEPEGLPNPGTARAHIAATPAAPGGTPGWRDEHAHQTVLQQHVLFFDPDGDGVIWPLDTFWCFYALGFNVFLSIFAVFVIHPTFTYVTCPGWLPDPFLRVWTGSIHKGKHGGDTGAYDSEGRFIPHKFEDWFSKYGKGKDGVTLGDVFDAHKGQRVIFDPIGWTAEMLEWLATYVMLWPEDGVMKKEDCRRVYDGSIFYDIAMERIGTTNPRGQWKKKPNDWAW